MLAKGAIWVMQISLIFICSKEKICKDWYGIIEYSGSVEEEQVNNMRYEDSMKGVADQIIKEQQRASKIKNNPEEFHWHDEYATLNFFRFICKNIGNLRNMPYNTPIPKGAISLCPENARKSTSSD